MAETTDLRARRRRQTTLEIHAAALRLARAQGFDNVTIQQISAEAGVSQRTFFNYFPTKEAAVAYAPLEIPDELAAEFIARGRARQAVVLTELIALVTQQLGEQPPPRGYTEDIMAVSRQHPSVLAASLALFEDFHATVAEVAAQRLGLGAESEIPQLIAGVTMMTVRTGIDMWAQAAPAEPDTPVPYVTRAARVLRSLLGADDNTARNPGQPRQSPAPRKRPTKTARR